jgi:hypothetical protein
MSEMTETSCSIAVVSLTTNAYLFTISAWVRMEESNKKMGRIELGASVEGN